MKTDGSRFLVSAIVSTYCAEQYIAGCLEDLEAQTIADRLEIVVVNSGSPQNEDAIIREFQKKYDNIRYIRTEKRETIYAAWNRAIKISSGKYITNANTDDRHRKDSLEIMAKALDDNPKKVLVYGNQNIVKPYKGRNIPVGEGNYGYYLRQRLLTRELDVGSQPMWKRTLHDEFGYFDENFFVAGDTEFWLRVSQKYDFMYINQILGERLFRPDGVWLSEKDGICEIEKIIILNCFNYAKEKQEEVDHKGISRNPVFSGWHEVNIWKQLVHDKLSGIRTEMRGNIRTVRDFRKNKSPLLTLIIVTHSQPDVLLENVKALRHQSEQSFEVIVASNDPLPQPEEISGELAQGICFIEMKNNFGYSLSRNLAVPYSRSEYVAFLGDDAIAQQDFVRNIITAFRKYNIHGLRGKILPRNGRLNPAHYNPGDEIMPAACDITGNSAFKKSTFLELGGFNPSLSCYGGSELSYRIYKSRDNDLDSFMYVPEVIVYKDYYKDGNDFLEENIRRVTAEKIMGQRDPEFLRYLQSMDGFYSQKSYDYRYKKLISWGKLYENKNPERAVKYIEKAIEANPFEYLAYFHLGMLYANLGRMQQAQVMLGKTISILEEMMSLESGKLLALRNKSEIEQCYISSSIKLASILFSFGESENAADMLTKLINNRTFRISPRQELEIRQWLEKVNNIRIQDRPLKEAEHLNQQGENYFISGDCKSALDAFTKAIEIYPEYATSYSNIGVIYWQEGEVKKAMEYFGKALKCDPFNRYAIINCGKLLEGFEDIDEAKRLYAKYLEKNPDDEEIFQLLSGL
jgi:GT2 family glycosyltransferase